MRSLSVLVLGAVLALMWSGCAGNGDSRRAEPSGRAASSVRTTVYFLADAGSAPIGVRRTLERRSPFAREALDVLLAGPTAAERRRGLITALPDATRVLSLTRPGPMSTVAVVDLTGLPPARGRAGEAASLGMRLRVITQVARTLIGLSGIERVELRVDGKAWDLWTIHGGIVRTRTDYERLAGWTRVCGGRSAQERELNLSRCFSALP